MSQTRMLVVIAGAALSFGGTALAQTASNDGQRAYGAELVADAGARTSFRADGGAGYDKNGFMIGSADGNNTLYVFGSAQIRYNMSFRDDNASFPDDPDGAGPSAGRTPPRSFTHGFENNLTRIGVRGNIWDKAFTYQVRGEFDNTGGFALETGFAKYSWDNGFGVMVGQFKHPLFRESIIDNEYQLSAQRSIANAWFGDTYSQGIQAEYKTEMFRFIGGFTDGQSSANTPYTSNGEQDWAVNGRGEVKILGSNWERFDDFTSWRSSDDMGLLVGVGGHYEQGGDTFGTTLPGEGAQRRFLYTADAQFEGKGFNVFGAFYGQHAEGRSAGAPSDRNDFGAVVQGGIFLTDQIEFFARWDALWFSSRQADTAGDKAKDQNFVTAGFNYYISPESHAAKVTLDAVWAVNKAGTYLFAPDADGDPTTTGDSGPLAGSTAYGILGQDANNEFGVQIQLQVVF